MNVSLDNIPVRDSLKIIPASISGLLIQDIHPLHCRVCNAISIEIANDEIVASTGKSMQESNLGGIMINQNILCIFALVCTGVSACLFVPWFV